VEGYKEGIVCTFSDDGVGVGLAGTVLYSGWGTWIFVLPSCSSRGFITTSNVACSSSTSVCSLRIAATNLVCYIVYGGSSIYSMHLALCLALFILLFCEYMISRRSTGAGESSGLAWSVFVLPSPFYFRVLGRCGSFFTLAAEPRIKTNFYSSSYASYYSLASLAYSSTLLECVPLC
jgi:hypothetical protein